MGGIIARRAPDGPELGTEDARGFRQQPARDSMMSGDGGLWLLVLGSAGATGSYCTVLRYYRNTDQSHAFEHDTTVDAKPVTGTKEKLKRTRIVVL
jgi:hypothetical protein